MRLPDFVIAGVPRCGTTTLAAYLTMSPDIYLPQRKELHYFTLNVDRGLDWYGRHFAGAAPGQVCGEATPAYLYHADAMTRMARTLPDAKVLVVLRNPVARAYSHFRLNQWKGVERLNFEAALDAEKGRLERDPGASHLAYVGNGDYVSQLRRLFTLYPREQVLVVSFDDMARQADAVVADVRRFLGVPQHEQLLEPERRNHHGPVRSVWLSSLARTLPGPLCRTIREWNTKPGDYPPMNTRTYDALTRHFETMQRQLGSIVNTNLGWEKGAA